MQGMQQKNDHPFRRPDCDSSDSCSSNEVDNESFKKVSCNWSHCSWYATCSVIITDSQVWLSLTLRLMCYCGAITIDSQFCSARGAVSHMKHQCSDILPAPLANISEHRCSTTARAPERRIEGVSKVAVCWRAILFYSIVVWAQLSHIFLYNWLV